VTFQVCVNPSEQLVTSILRSYIGDATFILHL